MTDQMSIAAAKVPTAPVPHAGQQAHAHPHPAKHHAAADAPVPKYGEASGANGSGMTVKAQAIGAQDGALGQILSDALKVVSRSKPDGPMPDQRQEAGQAGQAEQVVAEAVRTLKDYLGGLPSELKFDYDEEADRQVFKVINPVTQEVVKQYPTDEFLSMIKRLKELAENADENGMLFDDRY